MARVVMYIFSMGLLLLTMARCDSGYHDVTHDPQFGDFRPVIGKWKSKIPLRLVEISGKHLYLVIGEPGIHETKELAKVPVGTEIRIDHLMSRETFETTYLEATGCLVAGPYADRQINLDDGLFEQDTVFRANISRGKPHVRQMKWAVAPDKLER
jgi:hypothetical protein